jgi:hypothetical protein
MRENFERRETRKGRELFKKIKTIFFFLNSLTYKKAGRFCLLMNQGRFGRLKDLKADRAEVEIISK